MQGEQVPQGPDSMILEPWAKINSSLFELFCWVFDAAKRKVTWVEGKYKGIFWVRDLSYILKDLFILSAYISKNIKH